MAKMQVQHPLNTPSLATRRNIELAVTASSHMQNLRRLKAHQMHLPAAYTQTTVHKAMEQPAHQSAPQLQAPSQPRRAPLRFAGEDTRVQTEKSGAPFLKVQVKRSLNLMQSLQRCCGQQS